MRLKVKGFSCLHSVDVEFKDVTVLIGEQGSGKSVLYKLAYYLVNKISRLSFSVLIDGGAFKSTNFLMHDFQEWFPLPTWGNYNFQICFQLGDAEIRVYRDNDNVRAEINDHLENELKALEQSFKYYQTLSDKEKPNSEKNSHIDFLVDFLVKELKNDLTRKIVGKGISTRQVYVPAGRALFTSLSKTVSVLTESDALDDITKEFAKIYISSLESLRKHGVNINSSSLFQEIFKGNFLNEGNSDFIETEDGRKLPLNILSSGQQEAFPLLALLCARASSSSKDRGGMIYVEELEAHLFPKAQGDFLELLITARKKSLGFNKLFLSTHSPYVLSKLNNLLLAGQIQSKMPQVHSRLIKIINSNAWLDEGSVSAYVLSGGQSHSIIDEDVGLIDGEYLDAFSSCLEEELFELMELERSAY